MKTVSSSYLQSASIRQAEKPVGSSWLSSQQLRERFPGDQGGLLRWIYQQVLNAVPGGYYRGTASQLYTLLGYRSQEVSLEELLLQLKQAGVLDYTLNHQPGRSKHFQIQFFSLAEIQTREELSSPEIGMQPGANREEMQSGGADGKKTSDTKKEALQDRTLLCL